MNDPDDVFGLLKTEEEEKRLEEARLLFEEEQKKTLAKSAREQIDANLKNIYALVAETEEIADKFNLAFDLEVSYGMGGTYYPESHSRFHDAGWAASSQSC